MQGDPGERGPKGPKGRTPDPNILPYVSLIHTIDVIMFWQMTKVALLRCLQAQRGDKGEKGYKGASYEKPPVLKGIQ